MKKIALVMVLGLLIQLVPMKVQASYTPSGGAAALGLLGLALFAGGNTSTTKAKTGNEFADLNSNPSFTNLLKQQAGGSLNTLDILK